MEPRIRDELLFETADEHLEQSHRSIHNWLVVHESTITQSIKRAANKAIQGMRSIQSYFSTGRPPGVTNARGRQVNRNRQTQEGTVSDENN
jgi:hypothetical protein